MEIHVTSDLLEKCEGKLSWELTTTDGKVILKESKPVEIMPGKNFRAHILNCNKEIREYGVRNLMLWLNLVVYGVNVSDNFVSFAKPKHLELVRPDTGLEIAGVGDKIMVTLKSGVPALWVWLEMDGIEAKYSDNFSTCGRVIL